MKHTVDIQRTGKHYGSYENVKQVIITCQRLFAV